MAEAKFSCHLIGADTLLAQCGEILLEKGHQVDGVVTDAPKIARWAAAHGIDVISASSDYGKVLQSRSFDYLFAITHLALIPDAAVTAPRKLAVNFHDGPLPAYAGLNTPMWAIINGETEYGISWHVMAAGIDEGDLLLQQQFPLADDETALSLNTKCFAAALESFPVLIDTLVEDRVSRTTQDLSQRTYFGRQDRPDNFGLLDWRRSAQDLDRLVRGLHTGPYQNNLGVAKAAMGDRLYVVDETEVVDNVGGAAPGTVIGLSGSAIEVACGSGALALKSLRDLTGKEQDVAGILRDLGLREGIELEVPEPALDARRLARSEDFWRQRLRRVEAPDLPYREATPGSAADAIRTVDLPVPAAFVERFGPDAVGAAFQLFLARVCAGNEIYCALPLASAATPLAAALGYTRFRLDPDKPAVEELERSADVIRSTIDKGPWLTDLLARSPELGGKEILTGAAAPALLIGAGNTMADGAPSDAAELSLIQGDAVRLAYRAAVYSESSITSLRRHFEALLAWLASASSEPAAEISLLSSDEWDQLVHGWNRTALEYDRTLTVDRAFAAQVQRTPDAVAVAANGEEVTYRQLDERINAAASALRQRGIGRDMLVGVHVPRSIDLVVATLGVMRAGGAYVPLDPAFPADRIEFMIEDSGMSTIISSASLRGTLPKTGAAVVDVQAMQRGGAQRLGDDEAGSDGLAYVIYTSGSTGRPKGVMLEHRNVINFFAAMDERIPKASSPGVWLAVTSLSFDISVLELFWTLTRGFKVVIYDEHATRKAGALPSTPMSKKLDMGLFMWGNDDAPGAAKYRLLMEGARYFDENGFAAVWTPERHFHAFGGPYPNPAVTGAAVAAITKNVKIRAGSCVVPLHHPVRIAEEWSVVDNLSDGRVEIAAASGWNPNDFVLMPGNHANNKQVMFDQLEQVRRLWRGEKLKFPGPLGKDVEVQSLPRPVQQELTCWITTAGNPETWREAGRLGLNVLTHLLGQTVAEVGEKIRAYRDARREAGFDPDAGRVALMLHTYVGRDNDEVRELVREPMKSYLSSSMKLAMDFAWSFPAFKRPGGDGAKPEDVDLAALSEEEIDTILNFAFDRYFETSGLFGDVDTCVAMLHSCADIGVDEIACLLDFGVETDRVMNSLPLLNDVRRIIDSRVSVPAIGAEAPDAEADLTFAGLVKAHQVTHMQCTPSTARMLLTDSDARQALAGVENLLLGGEALPLSLARELNQLSPGTLTNMYGPTETTIWSTTSAVEGDNPEVNIGTPIANTRVYVLDRFRSPVPVGVPGELFIGGEGVARGYFNRPELTAERFVADPFVGDGARMYATGDLVRWNAGGYLEYLGRTDFQVKVRGYRIELGEIEKQIEQMDPVAEAAVVVREAGDGDVRLVAYVVPRPASVLDPQAVRTSLREALPEYMVPNEVVEIEEMPQTANGKLDRKALQALKPKRPAVPVATVAAESDLEKRIAGLWCETLKLDRVGVDDNFFDLGGHSLLVVQLHKRIRESVERPVSLTDLYQFPTVRSLATHLEGSASSSSPGKGAQRGERRRALRRRGGR